MKIIENETMINRIKNGFESTYQKQPEHCFSCGGRFEILGNHTDHNHGCCLAATCDLVIYAGVSKREDNIVNFLSVGFPKFSIDLSSLEVNENEKTTSQSLIRGIAHYLKERGYVVGGFDAYVESLVPPGSGVSSSAAFELLIAEIFNNLYNKDSIERITLCKAGQFAERNYYGKMCGLLDQIGVGYGGYTYIDFKNIENPITAPTFIDLVGYQFVIVNSGGSHAGLDHLYSQIPQDMFDVAHHFNQSFLRDINEEQVIKAKDELELRKYNRAMHFYGENKRVELAKAAIERKDIETLIKLMNESRESSTNLLKNMCIDDVVVGSPLEACELIMKASNGKAGVKINGGGFAGTVISLIPVDVLDNVISVCKAKYGEKNVHLVNVRPFGPKEEK